MASYNDIRRAQAEQVVRSDNAQEINQARNNQEQIAQAQGQQVEQLKANEREAQFNRLLNQASRPSTALEQYTQAQAGQFAGEVLQDNANMAQIRGAQQLQAEAEAAQLASGGFNDANSDIGPAVDARNQVISQGLPDPRSEAVMDDRALEAYIRARN